MRLTTAATFALAATASNAVADPLWQPSDYDGVYVWIIDNATNGCWTNIGEVRLYTKDQLALAGFKVIDQPEYDPELPQPVLRDNIAAYQLHVNASRQEDGLCIGYLSSSFWGAVAPGYDQSKLIMGQIGFPYVWSVWNNENLNEYLYDQVRGTIRAWVKFGESNGAQQ